VTKRSAGYVVLALVLFIAGCGSPTAGPPSAAAPGSTAAQKVYDQINGLSGDQRTQTLLDLAKKDGQLSLYTSNTDIDDVVKAFEAKYGLKVETYRANSETVLQRILQESSAHYQGADIVETNAGELNDLQQQKLLSAYKGDCGTRSARRVKRTAGPPIASTRSWWVGTPTRWLQEPSPRR
jgi:iron(III) transport system substrate-binding protein